MPAKSDPIGRFWTKVDKTGGCWFWTAHRDTKGYGKFNAGDGPSTWVAHRYSWTLANGPIPDGLTVCHRCDNPPCVNPAHLFLGTNADNTADRDAKLRMARGTRNARSKLTPEQVQRIREMFTAGRSNRLIALDFGVREASIYQIRHGLTWAWLTTEPEAQP